MNHPFEHPEYPEQGKKKKDYWTSQRHYAGCYGAALFWLLSMVNLISQDWFASAVMGYVAGILCYVTYEVKIASSQKNKAEQSAEPAIEQHIHSTTPSTAKTVNEIPVVTETTTAKMPEAAVPPPLNQYVSPAQQQMAQFNTLYERAKPKLPIAAQDKFQDIHDLLNLMVHKFDRSNHLGSQLDMLNIQRVINHYVIPLIENYEDLPTFLLDRKKDNAPSPNEMLITQLNLIHDEVLKITEHVFQNNVSALSIHGDFLKQKLTPHEFFKVEKDSI